MNGLVKHATENAWLRPFQDGVLTIKPTRLSTASGAIGFIVSQGISVPLPDEGWWHAYYVGKLHMNFGNLDICPERWTRLDTLINSFSSFMKIFSVTGKSIPAHITWVYKQRSGAIVLAVPQRDTYRWADTEDLYFKIYAGVNHNTGQPNENPTTSTYIRVSNVTERQAAVVQYNNLVQSGKGHVTAWVNGKCIENLSVNDITLWDDFEILIDGRVKRVVDFTVGQLPTFASTLDGVRKYLLHLPKGSKSWTFNNDVEVYVKWKNELKYYAKLRHRDLRQLTFNDLSIPTEKIADMRNAFGAAVSDTDKMIIRLVIRDDYLNVPPLYSNDRIHDLYRLPDAKIIAALVGANANVKEWQAANLEGSYVNRLAAAQYENINRELCTNTYGYNAIARYFADTPQKLALTERGWMCSLPPILAKNSTVYEYDATGVLIGAYPNVDKTDYYAHNSNARIAEAIEGQSGEYLSITDDAPDFTLEETDNVTLWIRVLKDEVVTDEYYEAVKGVDYDREGETIKWKVDRTRRRPVVLHDANHLFSKVNLPTTHGHLQFQISCRNQDGALRPLWTPMETVEVWLNGKPLVHGIDFHVTWPSVTIVCKTWAADKDTNTVHWRVRGATKELRLPKTGWVANGLLSDNTHFDCKDDKVIRVIAGGGILLRDEVVFREDNSVGTNVVADGYPFAVDDPTIPLRDFAEGYTYGLRDIARDKDNRIESYLTTWFPTPSPKNVVNIDHWYHLYSPTINKLLWDIQNGTLKLNPEAGTDVITNGQIEEIMNRYKNFLVVDPAVIGYERKWVKIHPHLQYNVIEVTPMTYSFLERVNQLYLNAQVQLNQYLKIKG